MRSAFSLRCGIRETDVAIRFHERRAGLSRRLNRVSMMQFHAFATARKLEKMLRSDHSVGADHDVIPGVAWIGGDVVVNQDKRHWWTPSMC